MRFLRYPPISLFEKGGPERGRFFVSARFVR
jgi:hypothetical protein